MNASVILEDGGRLVFVLEPLCKKQGFRAGRRSLAAPSGAKEKNGRSKRELELVPSSSRGAARESGHPCAEHAVQHLSVHAFHWVRIAHPCELQRAAQVLRSVGGLQIPLLRRRGWRGEINFFFLFAGYFQRWQRDASKVCQSKNLDIDRWASFATRSLWQRTAPSAKRGAIATLRTSPATMRNFGRGRRGTQHCMECQPRLGASSTDHRQLARRRPGLWGSLLQPRRAEKPPLARGATRGESRGRYPLLSFLMSVLKDLIQPKT